MFEGIPDRRKGLIMGIVGGVIGAYAMRRYSRDLLPRLFPEGSAPEASQPLGDRAEWGTGVLMGIAYGATRTSTLPRDFAGGFFYGIRLWLGDEIIAPLVGLRAAPTHFSKRQHFALLTSYWVYSFVTTNATRLLYRLFAPEDW